MRSGYRKILEMLEKDRNWEESLAERFENMAREQSEPGLIQVLSDIARRCKKNSRKIAELLNQLSSEEYEVTVKCPLCGWGIPFGSNPAVGTERKCEVCAIWFRLDERGGDYHLKNIGRKDEK